MKFWVIHNGVVIDIYSSYEAAMEEAAAITARHKTNPAIVRRMPS